MSREAMRQALEALELAQTDVHWELNSPTRKVLRKAEKCLRAALAQPVPRREWQGLTDEEIDDGRDQPPTEDLCNWSFRQGVYFAEDKLKEKNT